MRSEAEVRWLPVRDVGDVRMGKQLSPASRVASGQFPYLRVANVRDGSIDFSDVNTMSFSSAEREHYGLRRGDILLNEGQENLMMVGRSAIYDGDPGAYCFQNTLIRFRSGSQLLPEYAQAVFAQWRARGVFASIAEKTSISHLGRNRFASLLFPLASCSEQWRIVEIVDAVKVQERAIQETITKLFSVRKGLLLGLMSPPRGQRFSGRWTQAPLREMISTAEYGLSEPLVPEPTGTPVLRMNNLEGGRVDLSDMRYCSVSVPAKLKLKYGDVLFNRTNSIDHVGKAAMWRSELPDATFASYLVRINPEGSRLTPEYLVEWLKHPITRQRVRSISTVAVQQVNVNPSRLREMDICFPTELSEQRRITSLLNSCDEQISAERAELSKVRATRKGLLGDLVAHGRPASDCRNGKAL